MKHFYTLLLVLTMVLGVSLKSQAYSVTVEFDHPENVSVTLDGASQQIPDDGKLTITASGDLKVSPAEGCFISSYIKDGKTIKPYRDSVSIFLNSADDGKTISFFTGKWEEARTATVNVNVINGADDVKLTIGNNVVLLKDGQQSFKFSPEMESSFTITPITPNTPIYSVKLNGTALESNPYYVQYSGELSDNDNIEIQFSEGSIIKEMATVTFVFEEKGREALTQIFNLSRSETITLNNENKCEIEKDQRIRLSFNMDDYSLDYVKIDGEQINVDPSFASYNLLVDADKTITIKATQPDYADVNFKVTVVNPEGLRLYSGSMLDGKRIYLENGTPAEAFTIKVQSTTESGSTTYRDINVAAGEAYTFDCSVSEKNPFVTFIEEEGYYLDGATTSDLMTAINSPAYISEGTPFYFILRKIERNSKAAVYVDGDVSKVIMANVHADPYDLVEGYNFIDFDADYDNTFRVLPTFETTGAFAVYLDGQTVPYSSDKKAWANIALANNSVLKIYTAGTPATYTLNCTLDPKAAATCTVDHLKVSDFSTGSVDVLAGTLVKLTLDENSCLKIDGQEAELDENNSYSFTADSNRELYVYNPVTGINSALTDPAATAEIFNLQGISVGNDIESLPAGLYIRDGKKIIKK